MPAKGPVESNVTRDFERRAQRMKEKLTSSDDDGSKQVSRESWMTELPPELKGFGLGPRTFKRRTDEKSGDKSIWTDTPADRERKAQEMQEAKKSTSKADEEIVLSARDKRLAEQLSSYNDSKRSESLMDMHHKKLKSKAAEDKKPQERRPFDRDQDLQVNRFDEVQKKALIKKSRELNTRKLCFLKMFFRVDGGVTADLVRKASFPGIQKVPFAVRVKIYPNLARMCGANIESIPERDNLIGNNSPDITVVGALGIYAIKVPKYLSQQWTKASGRGEVGKLRIAKNQGRTEVSFTLNEDLASISDIGGKPASVSAPREHPFLLQSVGGQTLTVFTESSAAILKDHYKFNTTALLSHDFFGCMPIKGGKIPEDNWVAYLTTFSGKSQLCLNSNVHLTSCAHMQCIDLLVHL
ncbi:hypothetical protein UY3_06074 [Chelonia mydas]|uniref:GPALPP motifs-containing protein 1 n=1 Tax=Chelonia mydas TaxID=8469 RepID=M7BXF8_CHEMY|nr:hypothetical protein UY3_06074 [Chelonia mydas]